MEAVAAKRFDLIETRELEQRFIMMVVMMMVMMMVMLMVMMMVMVMVEIMVMLMMTAMTMIAVDADAVGGLD